MEQDWFGTSASTLGGPSNNVPVCSEEKVSKKVRDEIIKRLSVDLIGPQNQDEVLLDKPSDVYMTGILWPAKTEFTSIDDDSATGSDSDEDDLQNTLPMQGQQKASSMGITFAPAGNDYFSDISNIITIGVF